eukprot:g6326.t1
MLLDDFDDIEEEEENERSEMKGNGRRRKRRGSYVMPSDFALANDDGSENEKSDDCVASMLENLFHESSSDNEEEEIFNDENNQDKENDPEKENVVVQYSGHARAKSLIERFNKRKEVRPKIIHSISQPSHSKDTEFNDVREYVRNLTSGNIEENQRKRMGTIAYELIESTGYTLPQPRPHVLGENVARLKTRRQKRKLLESIAPVLVDMEKHSKNEQKRLQSALQMKWRRRREDDEDDATYEYVCLKSGKIISPEEYTTAFEQYIAKLKVPMDEND